MLPLTVGLMNMITCLNLPGVPRGQQAPECHHYIRQLKSLWSLIAEHTVSKREHAQWTQLYDDGVHPLITCRVEPQSPQHSVYTGVCVCPYDAFPTYVKCLFVTCVHCVYMRDSRLSAMLVCPSGTDPLVSGLCRALWSSWLLTRLSTARYRYWYCSCGDKVQL